MSRGELGGDRTKSRCRQAKGLELRSACLHLSIRYWGRGTPTLAGAESGGWCTRPGVDQPDLIGVHDQQMGTAGTAATHNRVHKHNPFVKNDDRYLTNTEATAEEHIPLLARPLFVPSPWGV